MQLNEREGKAKASIRGAAVRVEFTLKATWEPRL